MQFDPDNEVFKLCAHGMSLEGEGQKKEAYKSFMQAWEQAKNNFEKFTAAHYVARHQQSIADKLRWDETALFFALKSEGENMRAHLPSLYLNIAKCYEDLKDFETAEKNYLLASSFANFLPGDGYGKMINAGIVRGIERVKRKFLQG